MTVDATETVTLTPLNSSPKHRLGEWGATAICGNDITSSCLYVAALATIYGGAYAPLCLLLVGGVLYLYRWIYAEVGDALPLNGGAYNCLLNTTSKFRASMAACMTILSYMATGVISASAAMHYAQNLVPGLPVDGATVALLGLFAVLTIIGITESSAVAVGIFALHLLTLAAFCLIGVVRLVRDPSMLIANWHAPTEASLGTAVFFGFAAALLGISGFESSCNFIEEQEEGVFPKTLRNMWLAVVVFNPLICLLVLGVIPVATVQAHKSSWPGGGSGPRSTSTPPSCCPGPCSPPMWARWASSSASPSIDACPSPCSRRIGGAAPAIASSSASFSSASRSCGSPAGSSRRWPASTPSPFSASWAGSPSAISSSRSSGGSSRAATGRAGPPW